MASTQSEQKYSLSLSGDGIDIQREVDQDLALEIVSIVLRGRPSGGSRAPREDTAERTSVKTAPVSLREYLDERQASRKPDQIVTIGHYICEHEGRDDFTRDEIKSRFSTAREPLPGNFPRDFSWTIKNGWIAEGHGKQGRYYVTARGMQAVESRFSSEVKKSTINPRGLARKRRRRNA